MHTQLLVRWAGLWGARISQKKTIPIIPKLGMELGGHREKQFEQPLPYEGEDRVWGRPREEQLNIRRDVCQDAWGETHSRLSISGRALISVHTKLNDKPTVLADQNHHIFEITSINNNTYLTTRGRFINNNKGIKVPCGKSYL